MQIAKGDNIKTYPQDATKGQYFSNPSIIEIDDFKQNIMPIYNQGDIEKMIGLFGKA